MSDLNGITEDLKADLVAYLDGELSDRASRDVEQTLAENPRVRREIDLLERTWDLLDTLPAGKASESFSQRTLTAVSQLAVPTAAEKMTAARQSGNWPIGRDAWIAAGASMALVLTAVVCFALTNRWMPTATDRLLSDLPLLIKLEMFEELSSAEYLLELKQSQMFNEQSHPGESP